MSKRLQVILDDEDLREIQEMARARRLTVAEWVRQALRDARRTEAKGDTAQKFAVIQTAASYSAPTADIDEMLKDIEAGYAGRSR